MARRHSSVKQTIVALILSSRGTPSLLVVGCRTGVCVGLGLSRALIGVRPGPVAAANDRR